jgi:hypothetical protein
LTLNSLWLLKNSKRVNEDLAFNNMSIKEAHQAERMFSANVRNIFFMILDDFLRFILREDFFKAI